MAEIKQSKYPAIEIYTDGSKDNKKVAAAAVINHDVFSVQLPNEATIFTAEAKAFELIKISKDIFSDPLSCLQSIHNTCMNIDHPYIFDILCNYLRASRQEK